MLTFLSKNMHYNLNELNYSLIDQENLSSSANELNRLLNQKLLWMPSYPKQLNDLILCINYLIKGEYFKLNKQEKGRPQKYTDEELTRTLLDYASKTPGRINYSALAKATGIKRHVWSRRKRTDIERLNTPLLSEKMMPLLFHYLISNLLLNVMVMIQKL